MSCSCKQSRSIITTMMKMVITVLNNGSYSSVEFNFKLSFWKYSSSYLVSFLQSEISILQQLAFIMQVIRILTIHHQIVPQ